MLEAVRSEGAAAVVRLAATQALLGEARQRRDAAVGARYLLRRDCDAFADGLTARQRADADHATRAAAASVFVSRDILGAPRRRSEPVLETRPAWQASWRRTAANSTAW